MDTNQKLLLAGYDRLVNLIYQSSSEPEMFIEIINQLIPLSHTSEKSHETKSTSEPKVPSVTDHAELIEGLLGHLERSLSIAEKFNVYEQEREKLSGLLDRLPLTIIICDGNGRIKAVNQEADNFLSGQKILYLSGEQQLCCKNSDDQTQLLDTIKRVARLTASASSDVHSLELSAPETGQTVNAKLFEVEDLDPETGEPAAMVAILIGDSEIGKHISFEAISERFGLTKTEANITEQVVNGLSAKHIAEKKSVSVHTVRAQIKSILGKTNTHRQGDLVKLALNFPSVPVRSVDLRGKLFNAISLDIESEVKYFVLSSGRKMAYREYGVGGKTRLVHCHSFAGCRFEVFGGEAACRKYGVHVVVPDRPGIGLSDPDHEQGVYGWADDLKELVDHLAWTSFSVSGLALGGPYALGVAHRLGKRIEAVLLVESAAPLGTVKYASHTDMLLYGSIPFVGRLSYHLHRSLMNLIARNLKRNPDKTLKRLINGLNKADRVTLFKKENYEFNKALSIESTRQGGTAHSSHQMLHQQEWQFDLSEINTKVLNFYGEPDLTTKQANEYLRYHLPDAKDFFKEGCGFANWYYDEWEFVITSWLKELGVEA